MRWSLQVGDILDVPADVLICSANVWLNLSGGVGGAFGLRYGPGMQQALHDFLARQGRAFVSRGEVIEMPPCGGPYRAVLHAVAVDAFYETSSAVVAELLAKSLARAAGLGARTVAVTALGCGYGRLSMTDFAEALGRVLDAEFPPVEHAVLGLRSRHDAEELTERVPRLGSA